MKITAETPAPEALKMSKNTAAVFKSYNLKCLSCKGLFNETIGRIAFNSGIDLKSFLDDLNRENI